MRPCNFFYNVSGEEAERLLHEYGTDGDFLARPSESQPTNFTLSVIRGALITHVKIENNGDSLVIPSAKEPFGSLAELVEHCIQNPDVLREKNGATIVLRNPVSVPPTEPAARDVRASAAQKWFHINMTAEEAATRLAKEKQWTFLVRESQRVPGNYVITVKSADTTSHIRIQRIPQSGKYHVGGGDEFDSVQELLDHYNSNPLVAEQSQRVVHLMHLIPSTCIPANAVKDRISLLSQETSPKRTGFAEEFERMNEPDDLSSKRCGKKEQNVPKNRYKNIVPFVTRMSWRSLTYSSLLLVLTIEVTYAQFDSSTCGVTKGCLFQPVGCNPAAGECTMSFSYLIVDDSMEMEISGRLAGDGYIAIGFSNDNAMGDDMVVFCGRSNGNIAPGLAHNNGKSNTMLNNNNIQTTNTVQAANGNIFCSLRQLLRPGAPNVKNLDDLYYILFATGGYTNNELGYHGQNKHISPRTDMRAYKRDASGQTIINGGNPLSDSDGAPKTKAQKLKMAHGIIMVCSWSFFLASGILSARYLRDNWPGTLFLGVKMWFNLHRGLNLIGIAGTICAFVCIFVANDWQWTGPKATHTKEQNDAWSSIHSILGLLACVIAWAQPLNAVFRCHPEQKGRFIFNAIHRFFGCGAFVLAAAATMIAVVHFHGMFSNRDAALGIYIAYICVLGVTIIVLELLKIKKWWGNRGRVSEMEMVRMGSGTGTSSAEDLDGRINVLQLLIWLAFVGLSIGAAVAISVLIGVN